MPKTPQSQLRVNILSNVTFYACNLLISLWFVRYLMHHIGVEVYGMVPLISSILSYLALVTQPLSASYGRHFTIEYERGLYQEANRLFNTALLTSAMLIGVVLVFAAAVAPFLYKVFVLPEGKEGEVLALYGCAVAAFACATLEANFGVSTWALNRFDIRNLVAFIGRLSHIGIVILLFKLSQEPHLWHVGIGIFGSACVTLAASVMLWRRLTPQLSINSLHWDQRAARELLDTSIWLVINQVGSLLFLNIDLFVVNILFGAKMTGTYGALLQISVAFRTVAGLLSGVLTPTIVQKLARDDMASITAITQRSIRYLGLLSALPVGMVCGFARPFLHLWLGAPFADYALLLVLLTCHLCINLAVLPLFSVQLSLNKVRVPGVVTLVSGVCNLVLAVILAKYTGLEVLGVALANATMLTIKNVLFTPIYGAHIQHLPWWTYFKPLGASAMVTAIVGVTSHLLVTHRAIHTWMDLAQWVLVGSLLYLTFIYWVVLSREDREQLLHVAGL